MNKIILSTDDYFNVPLYEIINKTSYPSKENNEEVIKENNDAGVKFEKRNSKEVIFNIIDQSKFTIFLLTHGNNLTNSRIIKDE